MDILQAARKLRPGTSWNLRGNILEAADEYTKSVTMPTSAELEATMSADAYKDQRASAYPSITDQLDALWKIINNQADADALAIKQKVADVKAQFPKPQGGM